MQRIVQQCLREAKNLGGSSIAFPAIGTGKLNFPPDAAFRIMLEESLEFCVANPSCSLKDIRFVVLEQDHALITALRQEMESLKSKRNLLGQVRSRLGQTNQIPANETDLSIEVLSGDLTQETTDAIMNIINSDVNMSNAGALSKAILTVCGPQVQQELSQLGKQTAGTAVMTSGGNLPVPHIIHIIPGW